MVWIVRWVTWEDKRMSWNSYREPRDLWCFSEDLRRIKLSSQTVRFLNWNGILELVFHYLLALYLLIRIGRAVSLLKSSIPTFFETGLVSSAENNESVYANNIQLSYTPPVHLPPPFPKTLSVEGMSIHPVSYASPSSRSADVPRKCCLHPAYSKSSILRPWCNTSFSKRPVNKRPPSSTRDLHHHLRKNTDDW